MAENKKEIIENYKFEPIKGYPMLNWRGKRPFTTTQYFPAQLKELHGKQDENGWMNKIFWGDNLQVMSHLLKEFRNKIDLIYIDPPFDSKADYKMKIKVKGSTVNSDISVFEEKQYGDIWNNDEYLQFMYDRIVLMKELLSDKGSIYIHCDYRKSHHLRCIMDEIFGTENFKNEIVWKRTSSHNMKSLGFVRSNDHILFYTKGSHFTFNEQYTPYGEEQMKRFQPDENGELYKAENLTFSSSNKNRQFTWRGTTPPANRSWGMSLEELEKLWEQGKILCKKDGTPRMDGWKIYLKETKGNPLSTFWDDVGRIGNTSSERTDYPTQKPEELLERIIRTSSNENDLVFDCFVGSGTTLAVASKLNRRFIGSDINLAATNIATKRLVSELTNMKSGLAIFNVNNYDLFRNPVEAKKVLIEALEINPISVGLYDGEKDGRMVKIMPVNRIASRADLNDLINGFDYKSFKKRKDENPNRPVERILLVCMGHEIDLKASLELASREAGFDIDVEVVDILRDKTDLQFKRDSEAKVSIKKGKIFIDKFYPMNLLQKLSIQKSKVEDWRELVESVMVDWNYDGVVLSPSVIDIADDDNLVVGDYEVPKDAGTIRVKITDLLSETLEIEVSNG